MDFTSVLWYSKNILCTIICKYMPLHAETLECPLKTKNDREIAKCFSMNLQESFAKFSLALIRNDPKCWILFLTLPCF